ERKRMGNFRHGREKVGWFPRCCTLPSTIQHPENAFLAPSGEVNWWRLVPEMLRKGYTNSPSKRLSKD
ncbi:hypothetical protein LTR72_012515, partial [Exophiala xenobiotica]